MNPLCPECNEELGEDFGIATCASCGVICFIDLDGNAIVKSEEDNPQEQDSLEEEDSSFEDEDSHSSEEIYSFENPSSFEANSYEDEASMDSGEDTEQDIESYEEESSDSEIDAEDFNSDSAEQEGGSYEAPLAQEYEAETEDYEDEENSEVVFSDAAEAPLEDDLESEVANGSSASATSAKPNPPTKPPMSGAKFFKDLEIFTEENQSEDYGHSFYALILTGMDTKNDLTDTIELLADERVGISESDITESWLSEDHKKITVPKISFLRLVYLYRRLRTLEFLKIDWLLSEDQDPEVEIEDQEEDPEETGGHEETESSFEAEEEPEDESEDY